MGIHVSVSQVSHQTRISGFPPFRQRSVNSVAQIRYHSFGRPASVLEDDACILHVIYEPSVFYCIIDQCTFPFLTVMSVFAPGYLTPKILRLVIDHVFMPPKLPRMYPGKRKERKTNTALCNSLIEAAQDFLRYLPPSEGPLWMKMIKAMELTRRAAKAPFNEADLQHVLSDMGIGGMYILFWALFRLWF